MGTLGVKAKKEEVAVSDWSSSLESEKPFRIYLCLLTHPPPPLLVNDLEKSLTRTDKRHPPPEQRVGSCISRTVQLPPSFLGRGPVQEHSHNRGA